MLKCTLLVLIGLNSPYIRDVLANDSKVHGYDSFSPPSRDCFSLKSEIRYELSDKRYDCTTLDSLIKIKNDILRNEFVINGGSGKDRCVAGIATLYCCKGYTDISNFTCSEQPHCVLVCKTKMNILDTSVCSCTHKDFTIPSDLNCTFCRRIIEDGEVKFDCSKDNTCANCNKQYLKSNEFCQPVCSPKCINSDCTKPNNCDCNAGYEKHLNKTNECIPVCKPACINGHCTKPNECACFNEYERISNHECRPKCDKCTNGICKSPNRCECNKGYKWSYKSADCLPECEPRCKNSTCVKPNKCKCLEGFRKSNIDDFKCEPYSLENNFYPVCNLHPYTSEGQGQGYTIGCTCNETGFILNQATGRCEPKCDPPCVNSICVDSNYCKCGNHYYNTTVVDGQHQCQLHTCTRNIAKTFMKVLDEKSCLEFDTKSPVLQFYYGKCQNEFPIDISCYDNLLDNSSELFHMYFTCHIKREILSNDFTDGKFCKWVPVHPEITDEKKLVRNLVSQKLYFQKLINGHQCALCLCPIKEYGQICLNETIIMQLCQCSTRTPEITQLTTEMTQRTALQEDYISDNINLNLAGFVPWVSKNTSNIIIGVLLVVLMFIVFTILGVCICRKRPSRPYDIDAD